MQAQDHNCVRVLLLAAPAPIVSNLDLLILG
jgi:hypothetical protein